MREKISENTCENDTEGKLQHVYSASGNIRPDDAGKKCVVFFECSQLEVHYSVPHHVLDEDFEVYLSRLLDLSIMSP